MENVVEMVKGRVRTSKRKFFPGYLLVKMDLNDQTWHLVKNTPRVTGFVGNARQPPPVPEAEVRRILGQISEGEEAPKPKHLYDVGDSVRVTDGPFSGFQGVVEDVRTDKGKLKVLLSMFGRDTPVELDFIQVEKVS
jgi:transcriptional antiterminator NusG